MPDEGFKPDEGHAPPEGESQAVISVHDSIDAIAEADWNACAGEANPFVSHQFLKALEESGSVEARAGWLPQHLVLTVGGAVAGCVPMYLKGHSQGEYVFDHGWAHAYERAGGRYYPKLQVSVPFTPVTGPRLLVRAGLDRADIAALLIAGMGQVAERHGVASLHVTFPEKWEWEAMGTAGWLQRTGQQYHWENKGYASFDEFLGELSSRKRKAIRKERREAAQSGVALEVVTGGDLKTRHWDAFYRFYRNTSDRKWGDPYLTRPFFDLLGERLADKVALVFGTREGEPVCGALNLIGRDALYGRNWGCAGHFRFLHFEACYYQAIDFAIARGLGRVEAGAQGQHKVQRGYLPVHTYSAHLIRDPALRRAIDRFLVEEREAVDWEIEAIADQASPFKQTGG